MIYRAGGFSTSLATVMKAAAAIEKALDAESTSLRLVLGSDAIEAVRSHAQQLLAELDAWQAVGADTGLDG